MRVLVTGAAGRIGTVVVQGLRERHQLRGFDRAAMPDLADAVVGDLEDLDACLRATEGMEAIIHLGARAGVISPWDQVLNSNIVGTYNIFEAARRTSVRRIAFASRAGLLSAYPRGQTRTVDLVPRPENYYSVSKVFGESLGYMYATQHGLEVVSVRIGNLKRDQEPPTHPHQLSQGDAVRCFEAAITRPGVTYEVVFGVSDSDWPLYDVNHGRQAIGYHPQDCACVAPEDREQ